MTSIKQCAWLFDDDDDDHYDDAWRFCVCVCPRQDSESVREYNLASHVILILGAPSAKELSRSVGLRNFLSPLRASSICSKDIKTVVFCVNRCVIEPEWNTVANFPKVFVFAVCYFAFSSTSLSLLWNSRCILKLRNEPALWSVIAQTYIRSKKLFVIGRYRTLRLANLSVSNWW